MGEPAGRTDGISERWRFSKCLSRKCSVRKILSHSRHFHWFLRTSFLCCSYTRYLRGATQQVGVWLADQKTAHATLRDEHVLWFGLGTHISRLGCSAQSADRLPLPICGRNG